MNIQSIELIATGRPELSSADLELCRKVSRRYPDHILFYRAPHYYALVGEDAEIGHALCGFKLESLGNLVVVTFGYSQLDPTLKAFAAAGYFVALYDPEIGDFLFG
jgi:DNA mismatch repair ATPase MutS